MPPPDVESELKAIVESFKSAHPKDQETLNQLKLLNVTILSLYQDALEKLGENSIALAGKFKRLLYNIRNFILKEPGGRFKKKDGIGLDYNFLIDQLSDLAASLEKKEDEVEAIALNFGLAGDRFEQWEKELRKIGPRAIESSAEDKRKRQGVVQGAPEKVPEIPLESNKRKREDILQELREKVSNLPLELHGSVFDAIHKIMNQIKEGKHENVAAVFEVFRFVRKEIDPRKISPQAIEGIAQDSSKRRVILREVKRMVLNLPLELQSCVLEAIHQTMHQIVERKHENAAAMFDVFELVRQYSVAAKSGPKVARGSLCFHCFMQQFMQDKI